MINVILINIINIYIQEKNDNVSKKCLELYNKLNYKIVEG